MASVTAQYDSGLNNRDIVVTVGPDDKALVIVSYYLESNPGAFGTVSSTTPLITEATWKGSETFTRADWADFQAPDGLTRTSIFGIELEYILNPTPGTDIVQTLDNGHTLYTYVYVIDQAVGLVGGSQPFFTVAAEQHGEFLAGGGTFDAVITSAGAVEDTDVLYLALCVTSWGTADAQPPAVEITTPPLNLLGQAAVITPTVPVDDGGPNWRQHLYFDIIDGAPNDPMGVVGIGLQIAGGAAGPRRRMFGTVIG